MKIRIDKETEKLLQEALKCGILDTLKIPALYSKRQLNFFYDIMSKANQVEEENDNEATKSTKRT